MTITLLHGSNKLQHHGVVVDHVFQLGPGSAWPLMPTAVVAALQPYPAAFCMILPAKTFHHLQCRGL